MIIGASPPTKPAHGVMATRPATAPDAPPSVVAWPVLIRSTSSHPSMAAAAARLVFTKAVAATDPELSAEPALKPNQPNHRMPVPTMVMVRLCGGIASRGQPRRLPRTSAPARAAAPALMCTTVPPAKSRAPRSKIQPAGLKTQWATGVYTSSSHRPVNAAQAENRMRSAMAPLISAGVMMAKVIWNAMNSKGGMVSASKPGGAFVIRSLSPTKSKFPITLPVPPNASVKHTSAHITEARPMQNTFCISMASTFLARTIPP